jgi:hypothetical protein
MNRYSPVHSAQRSERMRDAGLEAIARLSGPVSPGAISRLSAGWYFSDLIGLPLLTSR